MSILQHLSTENFITVNRTIAKLVGLEAAVIIGELASEQLYWAERDGLDEEGYFYSTVENLEKRTFLNAHSQRQALGILQERGFVDVEKKGMPARRFLRINEEEIEAALVNDKSLKFLTTSDSKNEQQDVKKMNDYINNNIDNKTKEKEKRKRNIYIDILDEVPKIREDEELRRTYIDFIEMRKFIKAPLTERALRMIISDTIKLGEGDPQQMRAILEQSIKNNWKGVFPLKSPRGSSSAPDNNPFSELLREEGYQ